MMKYEKVCLIQQTLTLNTHTDMNCLRRANALAGTNKTAVVSISPSHSLMSQGSWSLQMVSHGLLLFL